MRNKDELEDYDLLFGPTCWNDYFVTSYLPTVAFVEFELSIHIKLLFSLVQITEKIKNSPAPTPLL